MADQIVNYKCPACTAPLHYVGESGKLECDYCGSKFDVEEVEDFYAQQVQQAGESVSESSEEENSFATDSEWGADEEHMRAYHCPSCGAELICEETTAATSCPYCDNPTIIPEQFKGTLKPDLILPFVMSKKDAVQALKNHYKGKFFLPKVFSDENHIQEVRGIYVPFWLYDAKTTTDGTFRATRVFTHRQGDYRIIETLYYDVYRKGAAKFQNIPADGSKKMPDDYMESIEPYDYKDLKPFSIGYLAGYLADRYDVSAEENMYRVDDRCKHTAEALVERDVSGYATVQRKQCDVKIQRGKIQYALLPVWTLRTRWNGQEYLFMMNGQTGRFVGDLPVSRQKYWTTFAGLSVLFAVIFLVSGLGKGIAALILSLFS